MKARHHPTQAVLRAYLDFDPDTGIFIWKPRKKARGWKPGLFGKRAGSYNGSYIRVRFFGASYSVHRLAWIYTHGDVLGPDDQIDHINGDATDNRLVNLRVATNQQNMGNCRVYRNNTSGFKGVYYVKTRRKWIAQIGCCPRIYIGIFSTREEACHAYLRAAQARFGEFARAA